ncbi:NADH-cytochrome b5 reductase 2 isoform X2 [Arctopsyche grandis]|uniref:NADH-cytochrome b5 reductase 2 isoform X2 n=1 Tax=Arctopsyche grandis TaxID=121162 RepID=UPI00406D95F3
MAINNTQLVVGVTCVVATVIMVSFLLPCLKCKKKKKPQITLKDSSVKYPLPLIEKEELSHDTRRYRLGLPSENHILGLPIGQHIHLTAKIDNDLVIRSYTPVSCDEDQGYVDLVVKVYFKNVHPRFPDGGKMSQYLENMNIGDTIDVRGPSGRLTYLENGNFAIKKLRKDPPTKIFAKKLNMIAGGTGITPMLQLIRHICKDKDDSTEMRLLFANQTQNDILLRKELEDAQSQYPEQFKIWYTLDTPPQDWSYSGGHVNEEMLRDHMFPPGDDVLVLMCGPPPMINFACLPNLDKLGYKEDMRFAY